MMSNRNSGKLLAVGAHAVLFPEETVGGVAGGWERRKGAIAGAKGLLGYAEASGRGASTDSR
jgi:hypothetical protein